MILLARFCVIIHSYTQVRYKQGRIYIIRLLKEKGIYDQQIACMWNVQVVIFNAGEMFQFMCFFWKKNSHDSCVLFVCVCFIHFFF